MIHPEIFLSRDVTAEGKWRALSCLLVRYSFGVFSTVLERTTCYSSSYSRAAGSYVARSPDTGSAVSTSFFIMTDFRFTPGAEWGPAAINASLFLCLFLTRRSLKPT